MRHLLLRSLTLPARLGCVATRLSAGLILMLIDLPVQARYLDRVSLLSSCLPGGRPVSMLSNLRSWAGKRRRLLAGVVGVPKQKGV